MQFIVNSVNWHLTGCYIFILQPVGKNNTYQKQEDKNVLL